MPAKGQEKTYAGRLAGFDDVHSRCITDNRAPMTNQGGMRNMAMKELYY
jgi:hypothetical protein